MLPMRTPVKPHMRILQQIRALRAQPSFTGRPLIDMMPPAIYPDHQRHHPFLILNPSHNARKYTKFSPNIRLNV